MNIKTIVSTLLVAATILLPNTPLYAQEANSGSETVTPFVNGLGDRKDQAVDIFTNQRLNLFLQDADDEDWFKWTNNTGTPKYIIAAAYNQEKVNTPTIGVILKYATGTETTLLVSVPTKLGSKGPAAIENFYVPEGATLFIRVKADTFAEISPYELVFLP